MLLYPGMTLVVPLSFQSNEYSLAVGAGPVILPSCAAEIIGCSVSGAWMAGVGVVAVLVTRAMPPIMLNSSTATAARSSQRRRGGRSAIGARSIATTGSGCGRVVG